MKSRHFTLVDHMVMAMLAASGIAIKVVVVPLAQMVTGPLLIPGGVVAGGFYMLFLVLASAITGKRGAALMVSLLQAVLVTITGTLGSHGAASLFTYSMSGLAVEIWLLISGHRGCCALCCFGAGLVANVAGSVAVNLAIFRLPAVPLLLSLSAAALSGGLGGLVAHLAARGLHKSGILRPWGGF
ncbi:MAG: ECF transporter S component [Limnochordia bacterium]|jgi:hypothetical protein|nr:ECF transporter S component [Bacillota bacterium]NLL08766.1 ECF transporter S component [Bacillota bacterium]HBG10509.1 hypothetical protein [Bacillota bacterium]